MSHCRNWRKLISFTYCTFSSVHIRLQPCVFVSTSSKCVNQTCHWWTQLCILGTWPQTWTNPLPRKRSKHPEQRKGNVPILLFEHQLLICSAVNIKIFYSEQNWNNMEQYCTLNVFRLIFMFKVVWFKRFLLSFVSSRMLEHNKLFHPPDVCHKQNARTQFSLRDTFISNDINTVKYVFS